MSNSKGIQGWIRDLIEHPVQKKRDERSFIDQKNSCPSCHRPLAAHELEAALYTCPHCQHHFRLTAWERIRFTADEGVFQELSADIETANPLEFPDYEQKLAAAAQKTGVKEAVVSGLCKVDGQEVVLAVMDFRFIGGSMGSVVGEKIMRAMLVGAEKRLPVIIFTSSGGARMQEG
ncbi:MAG: carboxyl transferase domain-containing protein, partial [Spirochaetia bacterium]